MKNLFKFIVVPGIFLIIPFLNTFAQVSVNTDNSQPDPSAMLEVKSTTKGALLPRMTLAELSAISNPANGLQVFCTTDGKMYIFVSTLNLWKEVAYGPGTITPPFSCGSSITDSRDGKTYTTVQIGTQCWFKENMNIGTRINGALAQTNNSIIEKYCFNDLDSFCAIYGGLYQWNEMMQYVTTEGAKGICPTGWHIPTDAQWTIATTFLGGTSVAGGKMKTTGTVEAGTGLWYDPNTGATNESGFSALPAGIRDSGGNFWDVGFYGYWWCSLETGSNYALYRYMLYENGDVYSPITSKSYGNSVRCLRNL
ncbi:MAG: hypothetical protein NT004_12060 [Bacteroidetes bacterium]|nr:hypothetical protein [Bacteroidota bacterium]